MTAKYSLLEVVTYVGHKKGRMAADLVRYVNQQCVIVNPLGVYEGEPLLRYGIKFADGVEAWVTESGLQKYRAPTDQVQAFRKQLYETPSVSEGVKIVAIDGLDAAGLFTGDQIIAAIKRVLK